MQDCETKSIISDFLDQISLGRTFFPKWPTGWKLQFQLLSESKQKRKEKKTSMFVSAYSPVEACVLCAFALW